MHRHVNYMTESKVTWLLLSQRTPCRVMANSSGDDAQQLLQPVVGLTLATATKFSAHFKALHA